MRAKGLKVEARTRTISLLYSSSKKDDRISQIPSQFNDDTRFILSNNVGNDNSLLGAHTDEEVLIERKVVDGCEDRSRIVFEGWKGWRVKDGIEEVLFTAVVGLFKSGRSEKYGIRGRIPRHLDR